MGDPILTGPVHVSSASVSRFYFQCDINGHDMPSEDDGSRYEIFFLENGADIGDSVTVSAGNAMAKVYDDQLSGKAGRMVRTILFLVS